MPRKDSGEVSLEQALWFPMRLEPFCDTWLQLKKTATAIKFPKTYADKDHVQPRYSPMISTGRIACERPALQQLPKTYRDGILPPTPGHVWIKADYGQLELVTLAAHCERAYGYSELGETIRAGKDVHCVTGAAACGVSYETFCSWATSDDAERVDRYKRTRSACKAVNFSVGGGAGAKRLAIAARKWGLDLTVAKADMLRTIFFESFPEVEEHVQQDIVAVIAANLGCSGGEVEEYLGDSYQLAFFGDDLDDETDSFDEDQFEEIRDTLLYLCQRDRIADQIRELSPGAKLKRLVTGEPMACYAGFARQRLYYTERCNNPFQALAALAAKSALYRVWRRHRAIAFIHDEICVEAKLHQAKRIAKSVCRLMAGALFEFCPTLPVKIEVGIGPNWRDSDTELVFRFSPPGVGADR